ncbi:MAG: hypothetical protein H0X33_00310 [Taibaiella sp.]|nr:hypothetical protein [Taibaiella sp.]
MRFKVLMLSDDPTYANADIQLLRDKGILVYTCYNTDNMNTLVDEVAPDVLFINGTHPENYLNVYNAILSTDNMAKIPVVYTLTEDEVYLVNRKRTNEKGKLDIITNNITDAIKMALRSNKSYVPHVHVRVSPLYPFDMVGIRA